MQKIFILKRFYKLTVNKVISEDKICYTTYNYPICWCKSFHISPPFLDTKPKIETTVDQEFRTGIGEVFDELQKMGFEKSLIEVAIASTRCLNIEILVEKLVSTGKCFPIPDGRSILN